MLAARELRAISGTWERCLCPVQLHRRFCLDYTSPDTYAYSVEVMLDGAGCDAVQSFPSTISVLADPVSGPLMSAEYCEGSPVVSALSFDLEGGVGSPSYQWYDSSGLISGATSSSYTPMVDEVGSNTYWCLVTQEGANCSVETSSATVDVLLGAPVR